jgi:hypothetical protein
VEPKNLPVIVVPHGGPWARDGWGYNGMAQFLANRGYAVLQPNFRGSTGYGKKFLNSGNLQWGEKMQDDVTWGVNTWRSAGSRTPSASASWAAAMAATRRWPESLSRPTCTPPVWRSWRRRTC